MVMPPQSRQVDVEVAVVLWFLASRADAAAGGAS